MAAPVIVIHPEDNVAVALQDLEKGDVIRPTGGGEIIITNRIPASHKLALRDIPAGSAIIKYGENIGEAAEDIVKGEWVHTHNLTFGKKEGKADGNL